MKIIDPRTNRPFNVTNDFSTQTSTYPFMFGHDLLSLDYKPLSVKYILKMLDQCNTNTLDFSYFAEEMIATDPDLASVIMRRIEPITGSKFTIVPYSDDIEEKVGPRAKKRATEMADFIDDLFQEIDGLTQFITDLCMAIGTGISIIEFASSKSEDGYPSWRQEFDGTRTVFIPNLTKRDSDLFSLNPRNLNEVMLGYAYGEQQPLEPFSWVVHKSAQLSLGTIQRSSNVRLCSMAYVLKNHGFKGLVELIDRFTLPPVVGKFKRNPNKKTEEDDKNIARESVRNFHRTMRALMSEDTMLEFPQLPKLTDTSDTLTNAYNIGKTQYEMLFNGAVSQQGTGSDDGEKLQNAIHKKNMNDVSALCETLREQVIYPMMVRNTGVTDKKLTPRVHCSLRGTNNLAAAADGLIKLQQALTDANIEVPIPESYLLGILNIPTPIKGEKTFTLGGKKEDIKEEKTIITDG